MLRAFNATNTATSFFARDVDGRVLRMDSVSKCFGPGFRLVSGASIAVVAEGKGWVSCNELFFTKFLQIARMSRLAIA